jgi:hypothetical protein
VKAAWAGSRLYFLWAFRAPLAAALVLLLKERRAPVLEAAAG